MSYGSTTDIICLISSLVCAFIGGCIQPMVLLIGGWITDLYIINGQQIGNDKFLLDVFRLIYIGIICGVFVLILAVIQGICVHRATTKIVQKLRCDYLKAILRQDAQWIDKTSCGNISSLLNDNIDTISDGIGNKMCLMVRGFAMFTSSIIICSFISWKLTFVTLTMGPLSACVLHFLTKINEQTTKELMGLSSKSHSLIEESIINVRTVQMLNGYSFIIQKLRAINEQIKQFYHRNSFWIGFFDGLSLFVVYAITGIALFFGCRLFFDGQIANAGDVILIVNTVCVTGYFLGLLGPHLTSIKQATAAFSELNNLCETSPLLDGKGEELKNVQGHVLFNNVRFKYSTRDVEVLKGISIEAKPGETIALVGSSGSGKSTSIGLLTKMYKPTDGEIIVDGKNIDLLNTKSLRKCIGIVEQEPQLFDGTISENIKLGRCISDEAMISAANTANALHFIESLDQGFETRVGAGGVQLSGGQKQRIGICRALVASPSILVLDEATSALDSTNERIVNEALHNATVGRTTIIIAHRLNTLKHVDKIYVIENGEVKQVGKHDDLVHSDGPYAELARVQSSQLLSATGLAPRLSINSDARFSQATVTMSQRIQAVTPPSKSVVPAVESRITSHRPVFKNGLIKLLKYVKNHPHLLSTILILSIPRSIELCAYGLGLTFAFKTLQRSKDDYWTWAVFTVCEQLAAGLVVWIMHSLIIYLTNRMANEVMNELKINLVSYLLHKPINYFDKSESSPNVCVSKIGANVNNCYSCVDHRAIRFVWFGLGTILSLLLAFPFVWELGVLGIAITALLTVVTFYFVGIAHGAHSDKADNDKSAPFFVETIEHIRTIKLLAVEEYFADKFSEYVSQAEVYEKTIGIVSALNFAITQSYVFACDMLLFYIGTLLIYNGQYTADLIFLAFNGAQMSAWGVMYFSPFIPEIIRGSSSAYQLFQLLDDDEDHHKEDNYQTKNKPKIKGHVNIHNLTFSYPSNPAKIVCDRLSIDVPIGKSIGLVGRSGSGKSTIISLLEKFYEPVNGTVTIDENNINNIDENHLRNNIALVSQEPVLFNATIYENITIGLRDISLEDVRRACIAANASSFIENFPSGYDTIVGEGGSSLSGGQKQRIAIARAIVRNPKILLLDEATSALDGESENVIQNALRTIGKDRTCITIAHRLSTIQHCDRIYYISKGRVAEFGTHEELMKMNSKYAKLIEAQSS